MILRLLACVAFGLAVMLATAPARAAPPADQAPTWSSLTRPQQAALAPLQHDWATISIQQRQKWLEVASRFPRMAPAERQRVQARMGEWARMTTAERTRARLQFQEAREVPPDERRAKWRAYQALTEDQRKLLAQRAASAPRQASAPDAAARHRDSGNRRPAPASLAQNSRPVSPIVVQAGPGATTTTLSAIPPRPLRRPPGRSRIAAASGLVDPATLLPRHGPQNVAASAARAASAPVKP